MHKNIEWLIKRPIAHRGLHKGIAIPENSLTAFEEALKSDYPIELDIQITKDGSIIVFHDDNLLRMTGNELKVKNLTKNNLSKFHLYQTEQKIPLLEEVLNLIDCRIPILIEIKNEGLPGKIELNTLKILQNYKGEFAIQSFNPLTIAFIRFLNKNIVRGLLLTREDQKDLSFFKKLIINENFALSLCKPDFAAYDIEYLDEKTSAKIKKRNIPLITWTVKKENQLIKAKNLAENVIFENIIP